MIQREEAAFSMEYCTHTRAFSKNWKFSAVIYWSRRVNACRYTPFSFITINNVTGSSTTERVLVSLHRLRRPRRGPAFVRTWSALYNSSELP